MNIQNYITRIDIKLREKLNPYLGPLRRCLGGVKTPFTIISNNCWGGHVYRYFNMPYDSPTIGLFFESTDYIKFISNLKHYINQELQFITLEESRNKDLLIRQNSDKCPIGVLDDIEIYFLHYKTQEEAFEKWNRRKARIHWNNLYFKMTEQNGCTIEQIRQFDKLPYKDKFIFVHKNYGIPSQVLFKDFEDEEYVLNDTMRFRHYINLINWINHKPFKKHQ